MTEQQGNNFGEDRPGPYQGVFGSGPQSPGNFGTGPSGHTPPGDRPNPYADGPGPYRGVYGASGDQSSYRSDPSDYRSNPSGHGADPSGYGADPSGYRSQRTGYWSDASGYRVEPPKQVTIAAVISLALGAMCLMLAGLALTSAGEQISEVLTGSRDNASVAVTAALVCAVVYALPAIYLRKRRPWSRYMLIGVAAIGILGGVMALPASILGLAIHGTLMILMLQTPTRLWFHHR